MILEAIFRGKNALLLYYFPTNISKCVDRLVIGVGKPEYLNRSFG